jgi:hypothetical protein
MKRTSLVCAGIVLLAFSPLAEAGRMHVDIYAGFDLTKAPSVGNLSSLAGGFDLTEDDFRLGHDFGHPFGLKEFVAVVSFEQYFSTDGLYISSMNGFDSPVYGTGMYIPGVRNAAGWRFGSAVNELPFSAGVSSFQLLFASVEAYQENLLIGLPTDPFSMIVGGQPAKLAFSTFRPWGPASLGYAQVMPDAGTTLSLLGAGFLSLLFLRAGFRRKR